MIVGVKLVWSDVTWGIIVNGTIEGFLIALVALGIAIVYRANRIVNFSAADLGGTPAILALLLFSSWGWNVYLAAATGLVSAIVLGVVVEFAFLAMFLRIGVNGPSLGQVLDPALLLSALGAAVIGRMERLPSVTCAAIGFGIVSQAARYHYSSDAYRSAIIAAIIAVALLAQRASTLSRLSGAATSTWQETREVRPIPAELRRDRAVRAARWVL